MDAPTRKLNVTNGRTWWFDCTIEGDRLVFGARTNHGVLKAGAGSILISDEMRTASHAEAMAEAARAASQLDRVTEPKLEGITIGQVARAMGIPTSDVVDIIGLSEGRMVPGSGVIGSVLRTRTGNTYDVADPIELARSRARLLAMRRHPAGKGLASS